MSSYFGSDFEKYYQSRGLKLPLSGIFGACQLLLRYVDNPAPQLDLLHILPGPHGGRDAGVVSSERIWSVPAHAVPALLPDPDLYLWFLRAVESAAAA